MVARRGGRLHVVRRRLERPRVGRAAQGRAETLPRHFRDTSETVGSWSWETLPATHRQIPPASTASHRRCPTPLASPTAPPTPTARQRRARDTSAGASAITVDEQHGADVNVISWSKQVNYLVVSGADDGSFRVADPPSPRARATRTQPLTHPHHPPFFVARAPRALAVTSGASSSPPLPSGLGPAFDSLGGAGCALHVAPRPNHLRRVVATRVVDYRRRRRGRPGTTDRRLPHRALLHTPKSRRRRRPPPPLRFARWWTSTSRMARKTTQSRCAPKRTPRESKETLLHTLPARFSRWTVCAGCSSSSRRRPRLGWRSETAQSSW